jgi:outer membrane protein assembly factor BamB
MMALALLGACAEPEFILPGERLDLRDGMPGADAVETNEARPISLSAPVVNADFPQRGGSARHMIPHPDLGATLTPVFAVDIGVGNTRRQRLTAEPLVLDGRVFTLDSGANVQAHTTAGEVLWSRSLVIEGNRRAQISGGGLAVAGDTVYAVTGYGTVTAMAVDTGTVRWIQDIDAPGSGAPTVFGDLVYVVGRDSRAWAIQAEDGRVRWQLQGSPSITNFGSGAGVAASGDVAIIPFPSGEVAATFPSGGVSRWSTVISGARPGDAAVVAASDIAADPVIDGNRVYIGNMSGRIVALEIDTGDRLWTATEGAAGPVAPAGDSLFVINDINQLVRLDRNTGSAIWRVQLPLSKEGGGLTRRTTRFVHYGPILAGGRLIVASSDGLLRQFDPVSGASVGDVALPAGAASSPVVAGGVLYVLTADGKLMAFR